MMCVMKIKSMEMKSMRGDAASIILHILNFLLLTALCRKLNWSGSSGFELIRGSTYFM